jgi:hypothetical protein
VSLVGDNQSELGRVKLRHAFDLALIITDGTSRPATRFAFPGSVHRLDRGHNHFFPSCTMRTHLNPSRQPRRSRVSHRLMNQFFAMGEN